MVCTHMVGWGDHEEQYCSAPGVSCGVARWRAGAAVPEGVGEQGGERAQRAVALSSGLFSQQERRLRGAVVQAAALQGETVYSKRTVALLHV